MFTICRSGGRSNDFVRIYAGRQRLEPFAVPMHPVFHGKLLQAFFIRTFFFQLAALLLAQVHIFHVRNPQLRQLAAAGRAIHLVAVENVNSTAIFAVMDIHHDESLLFFLTLRPVFDMHRTGKQKTLFF
ncbi:hypothetical protein DXC51_20325 [Eisenbergiella massiliensis]|uniref:Uncharacterized protein n=1 Tax=Eisenbergiella massiliensis TaxID=1720294 RepID=A0A3E3HZL7_9FIRM|nr:hypothetical protein DXC51_20325 [Eisenbergiella massiliensis]